MSTRIERRLTERLLTLTLRKAVGLIVGIATVLAVTAAVLERLIDPAFDTLPQALWFSVTTVSTVGYGDYVPESGAGKVVAAALMLTGLATDSADHECRRLDPGRRNGVVRHASRSCIT